MIYARSPRHGNPVRRARLIDVHSLRHSNPIRRTRLIWVRSPRHGNPVRRARLIDVHSLRHSNPIRRTRLIDARLLDVRVLLLAAFLFVGCDKTPRPAAGELPERAERIVTLAPHLAELVFAVGAGDRLVGVSAYSDYPPAVRDLPVVGDAFAINLERLRLLQPDLLLVWSTGMPAKTVDDLVNAGFPVLRIHTIGLEDVASALRRIGEVTGSSERAGQVAAAFEADLAELAASYGDRDRLQVFYQVSARPLYTINNAHYISGLIRICGGRNVFEDLGELAPTVDVEAVIARDPEVLLAPHAGGEDPFSAWDRWPSINANRYGSRFRLPVDELGRATPRLIAGGEAVCKALETARQQRRAASQ